MYRKIFIEPATETVKASTEHVNLGKNYVDLEADNLPIASDSFRTFLNIWAQNAFNIVGKLLTSVTAQCGQIWRIFNVLANFLGFIWQNLYAIGQIFVDENGQMLKNNLAIWSH